METLSAKDFYLRRWQQLKSGPPFSYETHFATLSTVISIATTMIVFYLSPIGWERSEFASRLIDSLSEYIPSIQKFDLIINIDNQYWKAFAAIHFAALPIHFLIGIASWSFLDEHVTMVYKKMSWKALFGNYLLAVFCVALPVHTPLVNLGPPHCWYIDQISEFFPTLLFSWFTLSGLTYWVGNMTIPLISKTFSRLFSTRKNNYG